MRKLIILLVNLSLLGTTNAQRPEEDFYSKYLVDGVHLGMTVEELLKVRPRAVGDSRLATSAVNMVEIVRNGTGNATAYCYWFKRGQLGAITKSERVKGIPLEQITSKTAEVVSALRGGFLQKGDEKIIRMRGPATGLLTAHLWESRKTGERLYQVVSDTEMTLYLFDPKLFGRENFFVGQEKLKGVEEHARSLRQMHKVAEEKAPVDILPKVQ